MSAAIGQILRAAPVIPVLTLDDAAWAGPLAEALAAGGLGVIEVTLRTPAALDAIRAMRRIPGVIAGAGTVINRAQMDLAIAAGSAFIVAPGLTEDLGRAARAHGIPFLPGVASASDIMRGLDLGFDHFKFFPAEAGGGIMALKALAAPFPQCRFCPTGGITPDSAPRWLALEQVLCVGGSWLVPEGTPDLAAVTRAARMASGLGPRAG